MQARFGWNERRQALMAGFCSFVLNEIRDQFVSPVYADGSFVTDKERPNDIDVVVELRGGTDGDKMRGLMFMHDHQERILDQYGVHFWINFPGASDFIAFFQYAGHKTAKFKGLDGRHAKGILRIK